MNELPLYQIVNWNENFENNGSRKIRNCLYVCIPNKFGGHGLTAVLNSGPGIEGQAVYGTWHLIVEYCSKQRSPRDGYLTADGKKDGVRLCVAELARMFKAPAEHVRRTLQVVRSVGWLSLLDGRPETPADFVPVVETGAEETPGQVAGQLPADFVPADGEANSDAPNVLEEEELLTGGFHSTVGENTGGFPAEVNKEVSKYPPTIPQGGLGDIEEAIKWLNTLFGRQRQWSYEERRILTEILPIEKDDRALLSWAYKLPRDDEEWALVDGKRTDKPKRSLIRLLEEFSSEVDKWRRVKGRGRLGPKKKPADEPLSSDWVGALKKLYGDDTPLPSFVNQLPESVREEVEAELKGASK
jgi:hypothetical protein